MEVVVLALAPWAGQIHIVKSRMVNTNNPICCHAAQGAKASTLIVNITVTFGNKMEVVALALDPWAGQIHIVNKRMVNKNNPICCHAAQGAKASTLIVNVTLAPWAGQIHIVN